MGDLQEVVKDFGGRFVLTVGVLEGEAAVLLRVEAFIFDLPANPPGVLGDFADVRLLKDEVGDPDEALALG